MMYTFENEKGEMLAVRNIVSMRLSAAAVDADGDWVNPQIVVVDDEGCHHTLSFNSKDAAIKEFKRATGHEVIA